MFLKSVMFIFAVNLLVPCSLTITANLFFNFSAKRGKLVTRRPCNSKYVWKVIGKPGLLVVIIHMIYLQSCHFYGTKRYVISIYSANCSNQFLWQMHLNPIGLGDTFFASLKLYGVMSHGESGQAKGGNGTDQNNPWDLFSLYTILVISNNF